MIGTVEWYNSAAGHGFIACHSRREDVFVNALHVEKAGLDGLAEGDEGRVRHRDRGADRETPRCAVAASDMMPRHG